MRERRRGSLALLSLKSEQRKAMEDYSSSPCELYWRAATPGAKEPPSALLCLLLLPPGEMKKRKNGWSEGAFFGPLTSRGLGSLAHKGSSKGARKKIWCLIR